MAAPYVSGLAALIWGLRPDFNSAEIRTVIQDSAHDLGTTGFDARFGWGRIDASAAMTFATTYHLPTSTPTPTPTPTSIPKKITLAPSLDAVLVSDPNINVQTTGALTPQNILIKFSSGQPLAEITTDFSANRNWSTITSNTDLNSGKSFIHGLVGQEGAGSSFSLYIPIPSGKESTSVAICPGASSLEQISLSCNNLQIKTLDDNDVSQVTIGDEEFWKVSGLTGTGGISIIDSFIVTDTMNRLQKGEQSNHLIDFGTVNGLLTPSDSFVVNFGSDWALGTITYADIDLLDDGTDVTLGASAGVNTWGVTIDNVNGEIIFFAPSSLPNNRR